MNGRYLIVFLLLGGVLYGLTTTVGNMLAEEDPMSVDSAQVEYPSVPVVGASSRGGSPVVPVPVSSRTASLFRHPAVYSVSVPQGCASADRLAYAAVSSATPLVSESYSASSAYPVSGGLYLTSSATLHSYGGGTESAAYISSGSRSAIPSASSLSGTSMTPPVSVPLSPALSPSWSASQSSYAFVASSAAMPYTSSQQSAPRRNGARRTIGTVGGNDGWVNWFDWYVNQEDATGGWTLSEGTYYFTEEQLRAAYEYWKSTQSSTMPIIHTFEDWLAWITGDSNNSCYQLAPIGDGMCMLLWLAVVYVVAVLYKQYKMNRKIHTL